jgi:hypothetical protein
MKTKIISAVTLLVLSVGALRAETIKTTCFAISDTSDFVLVADLLIHEDLHGLEQLASQGRCTALRAGTRVSAGLFDDFRKLRQVRPEGTATYWWVPLRDVSEN